MPFIFVFLMLLPVLEVISFVLVSRWIGLAPMLMLWAAFTALGVFLIRWQTFTVPRKVVEAMRAGVRPDTTVVRSGMIGFAAILFLIPGFFSDVAGLLLLLPPVQALLLRGVPQVRYQRRRWQQRTKPTPPPPHAQPPQNATIIDVDYTEVKPASPSKPRNNSPWNQGS
jgi:UPF0716 protein FxsA